MNPDQLSSLLIQLLSLPQETEWVEWKHNNGKPQMIAERLSALANSATLRQQDAAYMIWGIEDGTRRIVGTTFKPRKTKIGGEELENWLMRSLRPQIDLEIHEWIHRGEPIVLFKIPRAIQFSIRFGSEAYIRIGSLTKKLKEYPVKESELWQRLSSLPFEKGIAKSSLTGGEVLSLLDFASCFDLLKITLPSDQHGILEKLTEEKLLISKPGGEFDITNLGAILFAKDLQKFDKVGRKSLRAPSGNTTF